MKILSLNAWGGRCHQALIPFIQKWGKEADVLCLQEIFDSETRDKIYVNAQSDLLTQLKELLPDHRAYFVALEEKQGERDIPAEATAHAGYDFLNLMDENPLEKNMVDYGQAIFVRNSLKVTSEGHEFVYMYKNRLREVTFGDYDHGRAFQWVTIEGDKSPLVVGNIHGFWHKSGKGDTPERVEQSRKIVEIMERFVGSKVICGDFNLAPDTESVKMLESAGFRNLVTENGVRSTRSSIHTGPVKFADYIFTSADIKVEDFEVLQDEVSDHLPLVVEIA